MKKINFLTHINTLKPTEVKKFAASLRLTNPNLKVTLKIFNYYIRFYNRKKPPPKFEEAYEEIFGRTHENDSQLINLQNGLSDLFLKLKDYLIQQKIRNSKFEKEFLWLQILEERGLHHQKNLQLERLKKVEKGIQNIWSSVEKLKVYHYEFFRNDFQKNNPKIDNLQKGLESLEEFYKSMKLKFSAEIINRKSILPAQEYNPQLDTFLPNFKEISLDNLSKNSELYLVLVHFLKDKSPIQYKRLDNFLKENHDTLHQDESLTTIIYMLNFLAGEIRSGKTKKMKDMFNLYKFSLEQKIIIKNGRIDSTPFNNIVNTACFQKEFDWVRNFIKSHKQYLKESTKEETASVAEITVLFKEKKYNKIYSIFKEIKFKNGLLKVSGTIHLLASLFESEESDKLFTTLDSFVKYLKTNKSIGKVNKKAALNFSTILKYIIMQRLSKSQVEEELSKCNLIFFRAWLGNKILGYKQL